MPNRPRPVRGREHAVSAGVMVDGAHRQKILSYLLPADMKLRPGDAVEVPYGNRSMRGMVVYLSEHKGKATREVSHLWGVRAEPSEVNLALSIASYHFVTPEKVLTRLAPSRGKGATPLTVGKLALSHKGRLRLPERKTPRRLLVPAPAVDRHLLAAQEAETLAASGGQVLILCPSAKDVSDVMSFFSSGAVRLDATCPAGSWTAFRDGVATVGVGTRSAALYSAEKLSGIVVLDEAAAGHQELSQPYTNARDLASARSRAARCPLTLISPAPTAQAVAACSVHLPVGSSAAWPAVKAFDRFENGPSGAAVPESMARAISRARKSGREVLVLATSHGAVRRCRTCGLLRPCSEHPGVACIHPDANECPRCSATAVRTSGWDTARLEHIFGADTHVTTLAAAPTSAAKRTVVIYDVDGLLYSPELYLRENGSRFLSRASELAGSGGELLIGTSHLKNPLLRDLLDGRGFLPDAHRRAKQAVEDGLPPSARMVVVTFFRKTAPNVEHWPGYVSPPSEVAAGRWEVTVRIDKERLFELEDFVQKARKNSKGRVRVT